MALTEKQQTFGYYFGLLSGTASIAGFAYLVYKLANGKPMKADEVAGIAGIGRLKRKGRVSDSSVAKGMKALGTSAKACRITPALLREGMEVEREHADVTGLDEVQTARIAAAHLCEKRDYYSLLKKYVEG